MFAGLTDTAFLFSTFGCKFGCRYCPMSKWSGTLGERDLDDVVAELTEMSERKVFLAEPPRDSLRSARVGTRRLLDVALAGARHA